ncbi:MAG TPA: substrate-binding domain-containing protein [Tepidisphaeraceae bacterium]|nr:substrate-binding domain-containing protein [Tepidisphaeraceae bacterium]
MSISTWMRGALICAVAGAFVIGCNKKEEQSSNAGGAPSAGGPNKIVIGMVAKSQSNDVFVAAKKGAEDAARDLGPKYGVQVEINWQTPDSEDAQQQAQAIEQLSRGGAQGITVSCSDANTVTPAIDHAVERGVPVMCFDSDAPNSKRFAFFGTDDVDCGKAVMNELAKVMDEKGNIACLAGNPAAPNLQNRVNGVKEALKSYPNMHLIDVVHNEETKERGAEAVNQAESTTTPHIEGWAMIGGWPLFTQNALKWDPGTVKVVSVDALPAELAYLEDGHVEALYMQHCYDWGHKSVEILLNKIVKHQDPPEVRIIDKLERVTKDDVPKIRQEWHEWLGK